MKHELKIKPEYFAAVINGEKTFEIRNNADRNFQVSDILVLKSFDGEFNGNFVERTISYITDFEQKPGYVVLGLASKREQELARLLADSIDVNKALGFLIERSNNPGKDKALDILEAHVDECERVLAGSPSMPPVNITETIRTAPERIWLQVADQKEDSDYPFPEFHDEVSWCADSVVACEVPYVRADLAGQWPAHAVQDALVALSDIASLQRYTLGGHCDSFGQDCGAEMEQDDEGEYIMLAEALALSPSKQGD